MYVCQLSFECVADVELNVAQTAICQLLEAYRYNGQIIGREFPIVLNGHCFEVILVCPEQDSLAAKNNNDQVNIELQRLNRSGLSLPSLELMGLECQSDFTDVCTDTVPLIIYSTFVQSCSPVRCFEHFSPVPLYKLPESVRKPLIKWQESQAACDQLQMNALDEMEAGSVAQLSELDSTLSKQGMRLAREIQDATAKPVYYYLYRVGGSSLEAESNRVCPGCGGGWRLEQPLHNLFDFKCDPCGLVSNLSWDWQ